LKSINHASVILKQRQQQQTFFYIISHKFNYRLKEGNQPGRPERKQKRRKHKKALFAFAARNEQKFVNNQMAEKLSAYAT